MSKAFTIEGYSLDQLKQLGKEFLDALPTATIEEADAGWQCFALAYIGAITLTEQEEYQSQILFRILAKKMLEFEVNYALTTPNQ